MAELLRQGSSLAAVERSLILEGIAAKLFALLGEVLLDVDGPLTQLTPDHGGGETIRGCHGRVVQSTSSCSKS